MPFMTHPVFILAAAMVIFLFIVWAGLPFAIYGVRRRLDRVVENLDRIEAALGQTGASAGPGVVTPDGEPNGDHRAARRLLVELRKEMLQFAPAMRERVLDPENVVVYFQSDEGVDVPCLIFSLSGSGVRVSVPLHSLEEAFSGFSPDQFRDYAVAFLPEKYGFFTSASPDGRELQVNIEPRESNPLDLFIGIIREQMYDPIKGGAR